MQFRLPRPLSGPRNDVYFAYIVIASLGTMSGINSAKHSAHRSETTARRHRHCERSEAIYYDKLLNFVLDGIAFAFLDLHLVAMRHLFANPTSHVFRRRIKVHHIVQELVIELALHNFLDAREIDHHAVFIESFGLAEHRDNPVVAMQTAALAFVRERELVCPRNFNTLDNSVHITPRIPSCR